MIASVSYRLGCNQLSLDFVITGLNPSQDKRRDLLMTCTNITKYERGANPKLGFLVEVLDEVCI